MDVGVPDAPVSFDGHHVWDMLRQMKDVQQDTIMLLYDGAHQLISAARARLQLFDYEDILQNITGSAILSTTAILFTFTFLYCLVQRRKSGMPCEIPPVAVAKQATTETRKLISTPYTRYPHKNCSIFDLAKTAYEPDHTHAVIDMVEKLHIDVNIHIPSNGLTLFLCACLSGERNLVKYMLNKGADVTLTTKGGDCALYLATFGLLSSANPDLHSIALLSDLIYAGCDVNASNLSGYTALHRAAGHGNMVVIQTLLKHGADPYQASASGVYPMDSAINAGNLDAAKMLEIYVANPHGWELIEPHTPPHIKMGLQSPQRKHLIESARIFTSPRIMPNRII